MKFISLAKTFLNDKFTVCDIILQDTYKITSSVFDSMFMSIYYIDLLTTIINFLCSLQFCLMFICLWLNVYFLWAVKGCVVFRSGVLSMVSVYHSNAKFGTNISSTCVNNLEGCMGKAFSITISNSNVIKIWKTNWWWWSWYKIIEDGQKSGIWILWRPVSFDLF